MKWILRGLSHIHWNNWSPIRSTLRRQSNSKRNYWQLTCRTLFIFHPLWVNKKVSFATRKPLRAPHLSPQTTSRHTRVWGKWVATHTRALMQKRCFACVMFCISFVVYWIIELPVTVYSLIWSGFWRVSAPHIWTIQDYTVYGIIKSKRPDAA